jgi:hypothetical protein
MSLACTGSLPGVSRKRAGTARGDWVMALTASTPPRSPEEEGAAGVRIRRTANLLLTPGDFGAYKPSHSKGLRANDRKPSKQPVVDSNPTGGVDGVVTIDKDFPGGNPAGAGRRGATRSLLHIDHPTPCKSAPDSAQIPVTANDLRDRMGHHHPQHPQVISLPESSVGDGNGIGSIPPNQRMGGIGEPQR